MEVYVQKQMREKEEAEIIVSLRSILLIKMKNWKCKAPRKCCTYPSKEIRFSFEMIPAVLLSRIETMEHVSTIWTASRLLLPWTLLYCFIELTQTKSFLMICDSKPLVCLEKKFLSADDRATWERGKHLLSRFFLWFLWYTVWPK